MNNTRNEQVTAIMHKLAFLSVLLLGVWASAVSAETYAEHSTEYEYDERGRVTLVKRPDSLNIKYAYSDSKQSITVDSQSVDVLVTTVSLKGTNKTFDVQKRYVDFIGRTHRIEEHLSYQVKAGSQSQLTDPAGLDDDDVSRAAVWVATDYVYNADGQLQKIIHPLETGSTPPTTTYEYDDYGYVKKITLPNDAEYEYVYNKLGWLLQSTNPDGCTTKYGYNKKGTLTSVTSPTGVMTTYTYDSVGNLVSHTPATGRVLTYKYNDANELIEYTDKFQKTHTVTPANDGKGTTVIDTAIPGAPNVKQAYNPATNKLEVSVDDGSNSATWYLQHRFDMSVSGLDDAPDDRGEHFNIKNSDGTLAVTK